jgi:hypothetical protein
MAKASFTPVGNCPDLRGLAQCRDTLFCNTSARIAFVETPPGTPIRPSRRKHPEIYGQPELLLNQRVTRPWITITGACSAAKDDGTTICAYGSKLHNPLFFQVQWSLLIGNLAMTMRAYRKFFSNCAWRARIDGFPPRRQLTEISLWEAGAVKPCESRTCELTPAFSGARRP